MQISFPYGDPATCWVARGALDPDRIQELCIPFAELQRVVPYGAPQSPFEPYVKAVAPGALGAGNLNTLPDGGTHFLRYVERIKGGTEAIERIRQLAVSAGSQLFNRPFQAETFTKPSADATVGLGAHTDSLGGFLAIMLDGVKHFDLHPTAIRHPFGDNEVTWTNLQEHIRDSFVRQRVTLKPGDVLFVASHVLHWVSNDPGFTQHLRFSYPEDSWLCELEPILSAHILNGVVARDRYDSLLAATREMMSTGASSFTAFARHFELQDEILRALLAHGIYDGPTHNPAAPLQDPRRVLEALAIL